MMGRATDYRLLLIGDGAAAGIHPQLGVRPFPLGQGLLKNRSDLVATIQWGHGGSRTLTSVYEANLQYAGIGASCWLEGTSGRI